jgi:hypothetical protein
MNRQDLSIFGEGIVQLAIAGSNLVTDTAVIQPLLTHKHIHLHH